MTVWVVPEADSERGQCPWGKARGTAREGWESCPTGDWEDMGGWGV